VCQRVLGIKLVDDFALLLTFQDVNKHLILNFYDLDPFVSVSFLLLTL